MNHRQLAFAYAQHTLPYVCASGSHDTKTTDKVVYFISVAYIVAHF